eukprot:scaffold152915_cov30-Prasinocladus_malaysianus.AAC.2
MGRCFNSDRTQIAKGKRYVTTSNPTVVIGRTPRCEHRNGRCAGGAYINLGDFEPSRLGGLAGRGDEAVVGLGPRGLGLGDDGSILTVGSAP